MHLSCNNLRLAIIYRIQMSNLQKISVNGAAAIMRPVDRFFLSRLPVRRLRASRPTARCSPVRSRPLSLLLPLAPSVRAPRNYVSSRSRRGPALWNHRRGVLLHQMGGDLRLHWSQLLMNDLLPVFFGCLCWGFPATEWQHLNKENRQLQLKIIL